MGYFFWSQWGPIDIRGYYHALGYPLEFNDKTLLIKKTHAWVAEHVEIKLVPT